MLLIGLTGSIGMGKSETARMFERLGVPVYDADAAVHLLYAKGGAAVAPIGKLWPDVIVDGTVDRAALSRHVLGDPTPMRKLEEIAHPLVGEAQLQFLREMKAQGHAMVALDVPLIYETGGENRVDVVVVVSAPYDVQKSRVLARPGMDMAKFAAIHAKQVPDEEKRRRADFVVDSSQSLEHAHEQVESIIKALRGRQGKVLAERLKD